MSLDNQVPAPVETPRITEFTDEKGTKFKIGKFLGGGMEGRVFEGEVVELGKNADPSLKVGSKVAVKQQPLSEEKIDPMLREVEILEREGSYYGRTTVTADNNKEYMFIAIPLLKGTTLREVIYDIDPDPNAKVAVLGPGQPTLTTEEKTKASYSLLKGYMTQHLLGILHVDIKPDNLLFDRQTGEVKIIDFGNSYLMDLYSVHPNGFQSPGAIYAAQEKYIKGSIPTCSIKADGYAIAMNIASLWTKSCYEKDAKEVGVDWNMALNARETLDDILAPDATKPVEMPEDIWKIIRHMASLDPNGRPENIALADGVSDSRELKSLKEAQERIDKFKENALKKLPNDIRALASPDEQLKYDKIRLLASTDKLANPMTEFYKLREDLAKLNEIAATIYEIDSRGPPKTDEARDKRATQRQNAVENFNTALTQVLTANPNNETYKKLFTVSNDDPTVKMRQISKDAQKVKSKMLANAAKEGSLYVEVENQVAKIMNSSKEATTIRTGLMELYGDLILLATQDPTYAQQCKGITGMLDKMVIGLDTVRINEARILQGKAVRNDNVELEQKDLPEQFHLPPMTQDERKHGVWSQIKSAFKELYKDLKGTNKEQSVPKETPKQDVASQVLMPQGNPLFLSARPRTPSQSSMPRNPTVSPLQMPEQTGFTKYVDRIVNAATSVQKEVTLLLEILNYLRKNPTMTESHKMELAQMIGKQFEQTPKENMSPQASEIVKDLLKDMGKEDILQKGQEEHPLATTKHHQL